ncbi:rubrerythrin family protein [Natroniella sulfidigena]|uniref:ferritin-like domain-containing protein n=1 Tax=Natroniella sulfidigena TaxID=723921 RepID=UPI00200A242C|nr:ferritin family protein [Natroniella sulfidigena]MCK8816066.1 rubrerythrin family protein [Natroniella sulfidigena]
MEFAVENKLGVTKGTKLEDAVEMNFDGETKEVGLYLAMARQAQREGYPEIAEVLKTIAWEEAEHAARFAELNGMIDSTQENLEKMLKGEQGANKGKRQAAVTAKEEDIDPAHDYFDESAKDEARHARALKGLLDRYFG